MIHPFSSMPAVAFVDIYVTLSNCVASDQNKTNNRTASASISSITS
jgi:hypothetical protein